jgi:hypothetical protein
LFVPDVPKFGQPINNVTIPVAREATLECVVEDLAMYKVRISQPATGLSTAAVLK